MLPLSTVQLKDICDSTITFLSQHSPLPALRRHQPPSAPSSAHPPPAIPALPAPPPILNIAPLRERIDVVAGRPNTCASRTFALAALYYPSMRKQLDDSKAQLDSARAEVARLRERCKLLEQKLVEKEAEIKGLKRERDRERHERRRNSDVHQQMQEFGVAGVARATTMREGRDSSNRDSREIRPRQSHASLRTQSSMGTQSRRPSIDITRPLPQGTEEERARFRSAELYMTRTDSWSGAQLLQAVHDLNSEILQFAASATDSCSYDKDSRPSSSRSIQAMHDTSARLGQNLSRNLSNRDHSQDPLLLQLALQGCVIACIMKSLSTFCMGSPSKSDLILSQIYAHMSVAELQPTTSRWRALTHRHLHSLYPTLADYAVNELTESILRWASDICIVAGSSSSDSTSASSSPSPDGFRSRFTEQVRRIAKSVAKIAKVTREEIMSTNFEIVAVDHTETYDPTLMTDAYKDYAHPKGAILATTDLGLRCITRRGGSIDEGSTGVFEQRILLHPKVVLESVLEILG
ncbi:hypothetical protein AX16_003846 [Volvariella volvacea WC 439]|nr:hypothetical protein AX16_003846 [Volvariella volvacea WC 439]